MLDPYKDKNVKGVFLSFVVLLFLLINGAAQVPNSIVFKSGTDGHKSYRIPAILKAPNGNILAFCEGRVNDANDFGDINIVMKCSIDGGKTWSVLKTIVDYSNLQAGNPAPVVDLTDPAYPKGRIFLFYNTGNNHESEIRKGQGLREVFYIVSADAGETWSAPVNITTQVHRPKQPAINPAYNFTEDWRAFANTPGHAMQIARGVYRGRIYVAANHSAGKPLSHYADGRAFGYYTDDHGKTFHISEELSFPGSNEATAAELSDGKLILNARNQFGNVKARIVAISNNGGANWDTTYFDKNLPDPICEGAILNVGFHWGKAILAFCNAADTVSRNNLTLRISYNNGATWKKNFFIDGTKADGANNDYTAYSDIILLSKRNIGILYERNNYQEIVFTVRKF